MPFERRQSRGKIEKNYRKPNLCDLHPEYIFPNILESLDYKSLLNLKKTNPFLKNAVECFCLRLKKIDFSRESSVSYTVDEFKELFGNSTKISELNLEKCQWVTNEHVLPIVLKNVENLKILNLNCCNQICLEKKETMDMCKKLEIFHYKSLTITRVIERTPLRRVIERNQIPNVTITEI